MREFVRRELEAEGYHVRTASDGPETRSMVTSAACSDLLIMDIDLPLVEGLDILGRVQNRIPVLPVVVHSLFVELMNHPSVACAEAFVEKSEDLEQLKKTVADVLQR